jgi:hypothetical protein
MESQSAMKESVLEWFGAFASVDDGDSCH